MQTALVIIFITLSAVYAVWRIHRALQTSDDPCIGCQGCTFKELRRKNGENRHCAEKKVKEKFGGIKKM